MKRWIMTLAIVIILLQLSACASTPEIQTPETQTPEIQSTEVQTPETQTTEVQPTEVQTPELHCDLSYDMQKIASFADIFDEKSAEEWDAMGTYTILLEGLRTPVLVDMDGMDVLAVSAYGQTAELGTAGSVFQDSCPVSIRSTERAVVVNISRDYSGETMILTEGQCYKFQPVEAISTQVFVQKDGTLRYYRYWGEYVTSFEQWDTAPLDLCTSRDHFLYEEGYAEIRNGEVVFIPENTVTVSDKYDLDTMFAEAKVSGTYEEYETVDALLAANQARIDKNDN